MLKAILAGVGPVVTAATAVAIFLVRGLGTVSRNHGKGHRFEESRDFFLMWFVRGREGKWRREEGEMGKRKCIRGKVGLEGQLSIGCQDKR